MGSFLGEEKIGALSHNAGVITLQSSLVRVGGRMIKTGVLQRTIATDVTLTANTLYMIFVVFVGGVPQLRVSSNVNSVGPSGFPAWSLVGAFYSNGFSTSLGTFINISGTPISDTWDSGLAGVTNSAGAITPGSVTTNKQSIMRIGERIEFAFTYYKAANDGTAPGGGTWLASPNGFTVNSGKMVLNGGENFRNRCSGHISTSADGRIGVFNYTGGSEFAFQFANGSTNSLATTTTHPYAGTNFFFSGLISFPASGLSNVQLKDL